MRRAALALACLLAACGSDDRVGVGGKNFTEQRLLGELVAQTLEAEGMLVDRRLDLGGTFVCDAAIRAGQIDVYVEYTGTALTAILKEPPVAEPAAALRLVRARYQPAGLVWGEPLGFDDTFALVVRPEAGVRTISEAAAKAPGWTAGFGYEFKERADGYPGLARAYGLAFRDVKTMDLGLLYRALAERQVDLVAGNSTDGLIDHLGLVALADDRRFFPPYEAVPVVRHAALERHPRLGPALRTLGGTLDATTMRRLNYQVDGERRDPAAVVREFRAARASATTGPR